MFFSSICKTLWSTYMTASRTVTRSAPSASNWRAVIEPRASSSTAYTSEENHSGLSSPPCSLADDPRCRWRRSRRVFPANGKNCMICPEILSIERATCSPRLPKLLALTPRLPAVTASISGERQHHGHFVRRSSTQTLVPGFQVWHGRLFDL